MSERFTKVEFTKLDKVLYPTLRITKAKVIEYYIKKAPAMLELLFNRPAVLIRFPNGVDKEDCCARVPMDVFGYFSKYYSGYPPCDVEQLLSIFDS